MNPIITEARNHYIETCEDSKLKLSHIWDTTSPNQTVLNDIIFKCATPTEVRMKLSETDLYAISTPNAEIKNLMQTWHEDYLHRLGWSDEIPSTPNLCKMLAYCIRINRTCGSLRDKVVLELGGGNGQLAEMMKKFGIKCHIDIDIPESLYMAYVCTREKFPQAKCLWLEADTDIKHLEEDFDFIFVPVNLAYRLKDMSFDLFVNTASMGEMPNETIQYWMNFIQHHLKVDYFYGLNRFLNTIQLKNPNSYSTLRTKENEASVRFDDHWKILHWELEPEICRCPYEDSRIARYLEIVAKRLDRRDDDPGKMPAVGLEDWWRLRNIDSLGTHRSNQLVHDYTIFGTLFQIWNTIRITPSKGAVDMMLVYLQWIGKESIIFEEELYYQKLRGELV